MRYRMVEGDIVIEPAAGPGDCTVWPVRQADGSLSLCVIEPGVFHNFRISRCGLARLIAEAGEIFWAEERARYRECP